MSLISGFFRTLGRVSWCEPTAARCLVKCVRRVHVEPVSYKYERLRVELPEFPDGFEKPPIVLTPKVLTVGGKDLEMPDFVKNEVPEPEVDPKIAELLDKSRFLMLNGKKNYPSISSRRLKYLRVYYLAQGYYWPKLYDRHETLVPKKPQLREKRIAERKKLIEEKMKEMPRLVAEYREKVKLKREKRREEREKTNRLVIEARKRGINPKDAKAMSALKKGTEKRKEVSTKKGFRRKRTEE